MKRNTILNVFVFAFLLILLLEFILARAYPGWTFNTPGLVIFNHIVTYFAFFGLFLCTIILVRAPKVIVIVLGFMFFLFFCVASCSKVFPVDTITEPEDKTVLATYPDGKKLIIRQHKNARTNELLLDTVLVKDLLIFRRIYSMDNR